MSASGPSFCQMKQVLERHLSVCVTKCAWSPKMDLLLIANSHGQVSLHRHRSLQRVWQLVAPAEHSLVSGLAWRPDSLLIALAYNTGVVVLVSMETGSEVHRCEVVGGITALSWQQHSVPSSTPGDKDIWSDFMTPLPASDKWFTESSSSDSNSGGDQQSWQNSHLLDNQNTLTILAVGTETAQVFLYAFGFVHCATVDIGKRVAGTGKILDAQCSHDLHVLSVVAERKSELACSEGDEDEEIKDIIHVVCDLTVVAEHHKELYILSRKLAQIQSLFGYSSQAIDQLREAWEGILLEMDTKLDAYSGMKEEGEVSADFLDLLVFGYSSPEFYVFLNNKLTEKGLKKLRQSVELSYTNMHKLVVKQLEAVGQGLVFVLSQVLGMARTIDRFGLLGVEEDVVSASLKEAGAFLLKTGELQQVIGLSMRDFLAFLKWLSAVHLRITNSEMSNQELAKTTQQETSHILSFLHDTLEEIVTDKDGKTHRKFRLEGVGQYLKDEDLKSPQSTDNNPWVEFLELHPEALNHPLILPQRRHTSLIQEHVRLSQQLKKMAERSVQVIGKNIGITKGVSLFQVTGKTEINISQKSNPNTGKMYLMIIPGNKSPTFYFGEWDTDSNELYERVCDNSSETTIMIAPFTFTPTHCLSSSSLASPQKANLINQNQEAPIIASQFYSVDIASLLIQDFDNVMRSLFIQVPVSAMTNNLMSVRIPEECSVSDAKLDPFDLSKEVNVGNVRRLDIAAGLFGVSGERKVAVVVANHRRTMVLYEMEVDDGDEDGDDDEEANKSNN